jgi:hypothetical protein
LKQIIKDRLAAAPSIETDEASPINYTALAVHTEGYSAPDLQDLVARAVHQAAMRCSEKPGSKVHAIEYILFFDQNRDLMLDVVLDGFTGE